MVFQAFDWLRPTRPPAAARSDDGFAAVDAIVALSTLSIALIFSFQALQQARAAAEAAWEARQAQTLLAELLERPLDLSGPQGGSLQGFDWDLETLPMGAERPIEICRHAAKLRHRTSTRTYEAATLATCPPVETP